MLKSIIFGKKERKYSRRKKKYFETRAFLTKFTRIRRMWNEGKKNAPHKDFLLLLEGIQNVFVFFLHFFYGCSYLRFFIIFFLSFFWLRSEHKSTPLTHSNSPNSQQQVLHKFLNSYVDYISLVWSLTHNKHGISVFRSFTLLSRLPLLLFFICIQK